MRGGPNRIEYFKLKIEDLGSAFGGSFFMSPALMMAG